MACSVGTHTPYLFVRPGRTKFQPRPTFDALYSSLQSPHPTFILAPPPPRKMPTQSFAAIWLTFSAQDLAPWRWDKWTQFCGISLPPWAPQDLLDEQGSRVPNFPSEHLEAARTFAANFNGKTPAARIAYMRKQSDNDAAGRNAIIDWVDWMMKQCKFKRQLTEFIQDAHCHPRDFMAQMKWGPEQVSQSIHPSLAISDWPSSS
jgi:hypothetical protein